MTLRDLTLEAFERAVNGLVELDPMARGHLAELHGRVLRIALDGTPITIDLVPGHDGYLKLLGEFEGEPDATLSGSPFDLLRASAPDQGVGELFAGHVRFGGDEGLAQRFSQTLAGLDIDWEEFLAQRIGDVPAHEIGRLGRRARSGAQRFRANARETLSDYLTEESRLLPHRFEVEAFLEDVDTLRDDTERLEARIARLESRSGD
jgi:ubiquinone biosynthesis protein UbiJ